MIRSRSGQSATVSVLAGLALLLTACSATPGASVGTTPEPGAAEAPATGGLEFTGTTLAGEPFDAATLGGTPTVLWFWAPF